MIFFRKKEKLSSPQAIEFGLFDLLVSPVVTEKASNCLAANQVVFKVLGGASKSDIKEAVEKVFNVKVDAVNTLVVKGKAKNFRGKKGRRSDYKKAYVTLSEGYSIEVPNGL
ncbi:MAG: 50S ribosomal protein L23 [Alphaproteobacteria bacterium]